jgi:hypothetical protein
MKPTRTEQLFVMAALIKRAQDERLYYVADCGEKGQGLFAEEDIPAGEAIYHAGDKQENSYGTNDWEMTQAAMYTNHSRDPNSLVVKEDDKLFTVASRDIPADEEISVSYFQVTNVIGPGSRLLHNNEPIPPKDADELAKWAADNAVDLFGDWTKEGSAQVEKEAAEGFTGRAELMGSRGRALKYGRPEPEGRDHDRVVFTDDAEDQQSLMQTLRELAVTKGYKQHERPGGFLTVSGDNQDLSVYPTSKRDDIHKAWELIEGGMSKDDAWAQVEKEKDVYVQSAVPAASRELVRKHGLLSSQALLNNPEALEAFLSDRKGTDWEEDEEAFKQRIAEKLKDTFWGDSLKGPSVFFGDPDPDKITDVHPMRKLKAETVRVNLSKLLRDYPETRIAGSELQPYDPEGPEHQGDLRHYDLDIDKVREYAVKDPKELWKHYDEPEGARYASNVPHAQIITPSGSIPPEYLELQKEDLE